MLDVDTNEQIDALYSMVQIKGGKRIEKFQTPDISRAIRFVKWYAKRYNEGLLMEIEPINKKKL